MNRKQRRALCAALALSVSLAGAVPAFALEAEAPGTGYTQDLAKLEDGVLEYGELEDRVKNYYGPMKDAYMMATDTYTGDMAEIADLMLKSAQELKEDADNLEDAVKSGSVDSSDLQDAMTEIAINRATAKGYRSGANAMGRQIEYGTRDSSLKSLQRQVNQVVYNMQMAMNGYQQLAANRRAAAKGLEVAEDAKKLQDLMESQGSAVGADVLSAAAGLSSARSQLAALDTQLDSMQKSIAQFTGYGTSLPEIGEVPAADLAAIAAIDLAADTEKAVNNNYDVISLRGSTGGNMDSIQQTMTKTTTQTRNKLQDVEYAENQARSNLKTLYDTVMEKKAAWDAASTAWQSAQIAWNAAQLQQQTGALSALQYKQQELAYLQGQAAYQSADLALQQAFMNYDWAVRGLPISAQ